MVTKKAAKKTAAKKPAVAKASSVTTVRTVKAESSEKSTRSSSVFGNNLPNIVLAELVGTFVLTCVALMTASDVVPLFVGLTLAALVMVVGGVSGAHVNPAVTFGLWASNKIKMALVPIYWLSQLLGAAVALLAVTQLSGAGFSLNFTGHFAEFSWAIFGVELIGTAVFLWGLTSVLSRTDLGSAGKSLGVGLSLFVALVVAGTFYSGVRTQAIADYQEELSKTSSTESTDELAIPHEVYVNGATLNPAVALAVTETPESELRQTEPEEGEQEYSRISWEVILGTLIGAALGANLTRLIGYRF